MLTIFSPAKLNLFLHIIGQRDDGYHRLQTLFQLLDYGDTLRFEKRSDTQIILHSNLEIPPQQNLIYRAAFCLREAAQISSGVEIWLEKRLPLGGGLGGGSSNAAMTLRALNQLWDLHWSLDQLATLGKALGADVPVFVRGNTAWGEGIGDVLTPVELPERWFLVISPPCHALSAELYQHPHLKRNYTPITLNDFLTTPTENAFTPIVCQRYPVVAEVMDWLNLFTKAYLTGSGACVFACLDSQAQANQLYSQLPKNWFGFVAKSLASL